MPHIIEITDLSAPELAPYTRLTEAQLRNKLEPEKGIFIAESPKVIGTALDAGCEPLSFLMERRQIDGPAAGVLARCPDAAVYTADRSVLQALTGYALTHRYARLEDLAVDEAVRGQGVGGELLAAAKRWARNRRLEYLELNVLAQNESAIRLYESQDFVEATKVMRCML